jgi:hypothetical protein
MIESIVLSNNKLFDIAQWQQAIDASLYSLELDTPIPFESLDGYISVKWKKTSSDRTPMKTGFDCRHVPVDAAATGANFQRPSDTYLYALAIGWDDDLLPKVSAWIAAAAYAAATGGVILLPNSAPIRPDELLALIKDDIRLEYLPRHLEKLQREDREKQERLYRFDERPRTMIRNVGATKTRPPQARRLRRVGRKEQQWEILRFEGAHRALG